MNHQVKVGPSQRRTIPCPYHRPEGILSYSEQLLVWSGFASQDKSFLNMSDKALNSEIELLQRQLQEANDKIKAIQDGSGQPFRLLVETMHQGAATLCAEGKIAYSNQGLATLLNEPQEKLIGRCFPEFVKSEDRALFKQVFQQALQGNGSVEIELRLPNGSLNPVLVSLNAMPSDVPAAVGALITDFQLLVINTFVRVFSVTSVGMSFSSSLACWSPMNSYSMLMLSNP